MNQEENKITRRDIVRFALISPLVAGFLPAVNLEQNGRITKLNKQVFINAPNKIVPIDSSPKNLSKVKLTRQRKGAICRSSLVNNSNYLVRVKEVILFEIPPVCLSDWKDTPPTISFKLPKKKYNYELLEQRKSWRAKRHFYG